MDPHPPPRKRRSFLAYASAMLGMLSVFAVLCFHYPELLTSKEFRAVYSEQFARHLLLVGLCAAFILGTVAILRERNRRVAMVGVGSATLAVLIGGTNVQFDAIGQTPYSLGLDWFVISLFFSALVFVPLEHYLGKRRISPLRRGWRTDVAYFFMSHVLVQFILILVTASTSTIAGLAAFPSLKAAIQSLPVWAQFLLAGQQVELFQRQRQQEFDPAPQGQPGVPEALRVVGNLRRIGHAPVRQGRMPRPHRAAFARCAVADRDHEIHLRRLRPGERIPALGTQAFRWQAESVDQLHGQRLHRGPGMAAGAVGPETALAHVV